MPRRRHIVVGPALLLALLFAAPSLANEPAPAPDSTLAQEVKALSARLDAQAAELAKLKETLADPSAAKRDPLSIRAGDFHARFSGFVQADAVIYDQASVDEVDPSTGAPLNQTRFLIRRAHLRADLGWKLVSGAVELEGSTYKDALVRLFAAHVSVRWPGPDGAPPYVMATIGLMRIPFGFENQERDFQRLFMERSAVIRALFPGENDLGVRLQGGWRFFRYQLAAMNGHPVADQQFAALDPTASKDLLGRLGIELQAIGRLGIRAGLSALWGTGFHEGTPATKDTLIWHDTNNDGQVDPTELTGISGQPATPSQTFTRYAFGGDLGLTVELPRLGALRVYGELVWATNLDRGLEPADPVGVGRDLRELGWYAGFTQELTRWAAVGLRYDRYDPDADAREQVGASLVPRDRTFTTWAVVAAGRIEPYARLSLEYDHNTNALGRDPSGAPATLASDVVTLRGQLVF